MSRITDAINVGAYTRDAVDRPQLDLRYGGQNGWSPNLVEWVNNQAYVSRPLVCILLEPPRLFKVMPDSDKWIASLRSLFELHPTQIDGFNAGLKVDVEEHAVGGAGEVQHEFVNVTREASQPKFSYVEKYGRPIQTFLDFWIRYGMMDPETKFALMGTLYRDDEVKDHLADWYSATILTFVPDPLHRKIDKAWITTNVFPKNGNGDITAKRDLTTGQEVLKLDIEFTGISQVGYGVNQYAQSVLDQINMAHADPNMKSPFISDIHPDVTAQADTGFKAWTETVGAEHVTTAAT